MLKISTTLFLVFYSAFAFGLTDKNGVACLDGNNDEILKVFLNAKVPTKALFCFEEGDAILAKDPYNNSSSMSMSYGHASLSYRFLIAHEGLNEQTLDRIKSFCTDGSGIFSSAGQFSGKTLFSSEYAHAKKGLYDSVVNTYSNSKVTQELARLEDKEDVEDEKKESSSVGIRRIGLSIDEVKTIGDYQYTYSFPNHYFVELSPGSNQFFCPELNASLDMKEFLKLQKQLIRSYKSNRMVGCC